MKNKRVLDNLIFGAGLIAFSVLLYILAYNQAVYQGTGIFKSDVLAYMQKAMGEETIYPFPYPLFFALTRLIAFVMPVEAAISLAEVLLNALAVIAAKYYFEKLVFDGEVKEDNIGKHLFVTFAVFACFFLSMIFEPEGIHLPHKYNIYLGIFTGNPWHNATYIATRPFAITAFFSFAALLKDYEKKIDLKTAIFFSVSLLLTTLTKPSFTLVFVSTAGLVMAVRVIAAKFKTIKNTLLLGLCFVPTFIDLLRQFPGVFMSGDGTADRGIGFCFFDVWKLSNIYIPEAVFYANLFSIVCFFIFFKDIGKDVLYRFTLYLFAVSFIEAGILCEKGFRLQDFNFCWGYMHGIFFLWMVSAYKLLKATFDKSRKLPWLICGWTAFALQLISGIMYFLKIFSGATYE